MAAQCIRLIKFVISDDPKGGTRNLEVVKQWLKDGKKVNIVYTQKGIIHITSPVVFIQKNDDRIVKTDDAYLKINSFYPVKTLYSCCFLNETKNTVIYDKDILKTAKKAFEAGDIIKAETMQFITSPIVAFIDDNIFETSNGLLYMLKLTD